MTTRKRKPSPVLGAAATLVQNAHENFVTGRSKFRHTFEAEVASVCADPGQARKTFAPDELRSLAATMEAEGQLQPILVRRDPNNGRKWMIVAGERRWRAACLNGWDHLLAIEYDGDPEVASLLENLQRVDLTPHEEAKALHRLINEKGWTQAKAGEALGKTPSEVSGVLRILTLPPEMLELLTSEHPVTRNALIELARIPDEKVRAQLVNEARSGRLTVKAIRLRRDNPAPSLNRDRGASPKVFNFAVIERIAARLNDLRTTRPVMDEVNRARLVRLRHEIDALLEDI